MDLVQVDVVGAEPCEGRVHLLEDRLARQPASARTGMHPPEHHPLNPITKVVDVTAALQRLGDTSVQVSVTPVVPAVSNAPDADRDVLFFSRMRLATYE